MRKAILKLSYECNNNCIFCHAKTKENCKSKYFQEMFSKIRTIKNKVDCIVFSGGEPLLNKNFIPLAKVAKKQNLEVGVVTNARMLVLPKVKEMLRSIEPLCAYTTFHSSQRDIHEKITRVPGSYQQTVDGIKELLSFVPNLMVNIVIIKQNINTIKNSVEFLRDMNVQDVKLSFVESVMKSDISHTPEITMAAQKVKETIDTFPDVDIGWDGFPLCLMKGYEEKIKNLRTCNIEYISEAYENTFFRSDCGNKTKKMECKTCVREKECEGIYEMYLKLKDFQPTPYKDPHH